MKPSDKKSLRIRELARVCDLLANAARYASTADAALVIFAAQGVKAAKAWDIAPVHAAREAIRRNGWRMEQGAIANAKAATPSKFNCAVRAYGAALREFAACEYDLAQHSLGMAENQLNA